MLPPLASTHTLRERGGLPLFLSAQAAPLEPGKPICVFQFNIVLNDVFGEVVASKGSPQIKSVEKFGLLSQPGRPPPPQCLRIGEDEDIFVCDHILNRKVFS